MNEIYVALDFPTWEETKLFLHENQLNGVPVKIGMELFYREGPSIIEKLKKNNHPIFLDLKLHDIPTTVYHAMKNLAKLEVDLLNVHALGGSEMMKYAKEGLLAGSNPKHETKLISVTILTSLSQSTLTNDFLIQVDLEEYAVHLAKLTKNSGCDGVVCSVHEVEAIKKACGSDFITVTPGIRLEGANQHDQTRVATPGFAKKSGADRLVIGRSITMAENPIEAYKQAVKEWENE